MKKGTPGNKGGPSFKDGDLVFAKVKGYPAWPARVSAPADERGLKYHVFFYGTYETAIVPRDTIWIYNQATKEKYGKQKRKGFAEAIVEIETTPNIALPQDQDYLETPYETPSTEVQSDNVPSYTTEDSTVVTDDELPLTIDEGTRSKGATVPKGKATKRKADEVDRSTSGTPEYTDNQAKRTKVAEDAPSTPDLSAPTSRSGRQIKPKKFVDDDVIPSKADNKSDLCLNYSPTSSEVSNSSNRKDDPRKMWIHVKATGDMIEIDMDKDRPVKFDSKDAEVQWERATANNALKFKETVESGQFLPPEIRQKLEEKANRTPQEEEILQNEKLLQSRKEKTRHEKIEHRLVELDMAIKHSVHFEHPNMPKCLKLLDEMHQMSITPLMLKKQPHVVTTVRKLRKYIGPQNEPIDSKLAEDWKRHAQQIRCQADNIVRKMQPKFPKVDEDETFWESFDRALNEFREETKALAEWQVALLVADPTEKKKMSTK